MFICQCIPVFILNKVNVGKTLFANLGTVERGYFNPWRVTLTHLQKKDLSLNFEKSLILTIFNLADLEPAPHVPAM